MADDERPEPVSDHNHGRIDQVDLNSEMQRSYLDYAMSVIVGRALPDVRDGMKPVHRRVIYGMYDGGFRPDKSFSKCARVVGEVMGQYHPHGDAPIYDALVRLVQPWSLRYPLALGQGNFGSAGNLEAAAPRYTETKMAPLALEMVRDEVRAEAVERVGGRVGVVHQLKILFRDGSPFGHRLEVENAIPVLAAVEDHFDGLRQLVGLHERQHLEQLVARAEAAWKNHERFREVREPELAHEEVVKLEMQPFSDVRIGFLLERQANIEPDGLPACLVRAAVGRFHDARTAARRHDEAVMLGR